MKLMLDSESEEQKVDKHQTEKTGWRLERSAEPEPLQPWAMVLIFAGIAVAAAVICGVIWLFTHRGGSGEGGDPSGQFAAGATPAPGEDSDGEWRNLDEEPGTESDSDSSEAESDKHGDLDGNSGLEGDKEAGQSQDDEASKSDEAGQSQDNETSKSGEAGQSKEDENPRTDDVGQPQDDETVEADEAGQAENQEAFKSSEAEQPGEGDQESASNHSGEEKPAEGTEDSSAVQTSSTGNSSNGSSSQGGSSQGKVTMTFTSVQDSVTPKELVNLRSVPTTSDPANIVTQVKNGEVLSRVGLNEETGWSKLEYQGETLYAVTSNLTTDLNYTPPATSVQDPNQFITAEGRVINFKNCDNWVTAKEYANLRTEPSTSQGEATVSCQLRIGDRAHRTGYSEDTGWSRVEYNGEVLYIVSSLVIEVAMETEQTEQE